MATKKSLPWRTLACLAAILAVVASTSSPAEDHRKQQGGQGKHAQWTAEWWQWVYSLPVGVNPLFDETGEKADTAQPNPKAFYLVGVINESNTASRSITLPSGTSLFGPAINLQNDNVFNATPLTVPELRAQAADIVDTAVVFLELDGEARPDLVSRVKSPVFHYDLPAEDNIYQFFGTDVSGRIRPSVSDGYWFSIPPLPPGTHNLRYGGTMDFFGTPFTVAIEYVITVE